MITRPFNASVDWDGIHHCNFYIRKSCPCIKPGKKETEKIFPLTNWRIGRRCFLSALAGRTSRSGHASAAKRAWRICRRWRRWPGGRRATAPGARARPESSRWRCRRSSSRACTASWTRSTRPIRSSSGASRATPTRCRTSSTRRPFSGSSGMEYGIVYGMYSRNAILNSFNF